MSVKEMHEVNSGAAEEKTNPLLSAAMDGAESLEKYLSGLNPEEKRKILFEGYFLCDCARKGLLEAVRSLIECGADVEVSEDKEYWETTPLTLASDYGHLEMVRLLLDNGADMYSGTCFDSAVFGAAFYGHRDVVEEFLSRGFPLERRGEYRDCSLIATASNGGCLDTVTWLADRGSDMGAKDLSGRDALSYAAEKGHSDIVDFLLDRGCSVESVDEGGHTPLHHASSGLFPEVVEILLKRGANVDARDNSMHTPLSETLGTLRYQSDSCWKSLISTVEILLDYGADANFRTPEGKTSLAVLAEALRDGCRFGNSNDCIEPALEIAGKLVEHGAEMDAATSDATSGIIVKSTSALEAALSIPDKRFAIFLIENGASIDGFEDDETVRKLTGDYGEKMVRAFAGEGLNANLSVDNILSARLFASFVGVELPDLSRNRGDTGYREKYRENLSLFMSLSFDGLELDTNSFFHRKTVESIEKILKCGSGELDTEVFETTVRDVEREALSKALEREKKRTAPDSMDEEEEYGPPI